MTSMTLGTRIWPDHVVLYMMYGSYCIVLVQQGYVTLYVRSTSSVASRHVVPHCIIVLHECDTFTLLAEFAEYEDFSVH